LKIISISQFNFRAPTRQGVHRTGILYPCLRGLQQWFLAQCDAFSERAENLVAAAREKSKICPASMDAFVGEAVAASPERALGARFSLRVIDTLFVRTTNYAISNDHGFGGVLSQKGENLLANNRVSAHIHVLGEPSFEWIGFASFVTNDSDSDLGGEIGGGTVKGNRGGRKSAESATGFLAETMLQ
jgi:hypothetical protein